MREARRPPAPTEPEGLARSEGREGRGAPESRRSPEETLGEASNQFSYGRYERVVSLLRPIVERGLLRGREDQVEAMRIYGVCLHLTGRKAGAVELFRTLLRLAPETRLDPRLVQPEVVAAFEAVRREQLSNLREEARKRQGRRHAILNVLPSAGQFQNGQWQKGVTVLSQELAFLGMNIGSYYALRAPGLRQPDRTYVEKDAQGNVVKDHRTVAKALMAVNYGSLALLVGTFVYGVVDGFVVFYRQRRSLERLLGEPLVISPSLAPGACGLYLTYRY
jgi:hypothetical protein